MSAPEGTGRRAFPGWPAAVACTIAVTLAACGTPFAASPPVATGLRVVAGDGQRGTVGAVLSQPLEIAVVDARGDGVPGQPVSFVVTRDNATVDSADILTDADGHARAILRLGTRADTNVVQVATTVAGGRQISAQFHELALPGSPARIVAAGPTPMLGAPGQALPESLAARLVDDYGNGIPNATIAWVVVNGGGSVAPALDTADAQGRVTAQWILGSDSTQFAAAYFGTAGQFQDGTAVSAYFEAVIPAASASRAPPQPDYTASAPGRPPRPSLEIRRRMPIASQLASMKEPP